MRLAVDAMGGDHAPDAIVRGCIDALDILAPGDELILVGRENDIRDIMHERSVPADAPIRIDLWGDEVDRLTEFSVSDQRSVRDLDEALVFPARELVGSEAVQARAAGLVATEPWGREHWERLADGALFDGMESWLPWLVDEPQLLTDVLPATSKEIGRAHV